MTTQPKEPLWFQPSSTAASEADPSGDGTDFWGGMRTELRWRRTGTSILFEQIMRGGRWLQINYKGLLTVGSALGSGAASHSAKLRSILHTNTPSIDALDDPYAGICL